MIKEISEFADKGLHVFKLRLLVLHLTSVTLSVLNSILFEGVVVVAAIRLEFFIEGVDNFITGNIQKLSSVRDNHNSALAFADIVLEPHHSVKSRWLVGSSRRRTSGYTKRALTKETLIRQPPDNEPTGL